MRKPVLFKTERVSKASWYGRIKEIMIDAGWENVSSNPRTDFDVMHSVSDKGVPMYIQLREYMTYASSSIGNSDQRDFCLRFIQSYTPGASGVAGTFARPDESWHRMYFIPHPTPIHSEFYIHYHCNKNRLVLINEFPDGMKTIGDFTCDATMFMLGVSDESEGENERSAPVFAASHSNVSLAGTLMVTGHPALAKGSHQVPIIYELPPLNPNSAGLNFMSEIAYGGPDDGVRGIIDGIYALPTGPNNGLENGDDIIADDGRRFRIIKVHGSVASSHPGAFLFTDTYAFQPEAYGGAI